MKLTQYHQKRKIRKLLKIVDKPEVIEALRTSGYKLDLDYLKKMDIKSLKRPRKPAS